MDLSRTLQLHTVRLEVSEATLAELREAKAEPAAPRFAPVPPVSALQSGDTLRIESASVRTLAFELPRDLVQRPAGGGLTDTLYDGGALRDLAGQLAAVRESESAAPPAAERVPAPRNPTLIDAMRRPLAAFRKSSWQKQLTIALLPLAIAGVWAMRDGSASASSARPVASVRAPVPSAAPPPTRAASAQTTNPILTASNSVGPSSERTPLEVAARPSDAARPGDPSERLALIAAFSGNKAEAAELYERLATTRNSRTFALAARLAREDRVRKP
jgi:hypothetical protein